ncbi:hypothetical protein DPMN_107236 [Dreissena polymorpha]|uniref:Uncharacterized protein n=1 Tax=Dreissena polymorpha TaxID=45954 RepID=A0A9D4K6K1_DREPO|nr:hypothetical protein DPMN_107236 [Dreissena polymorpha]
MPKDLGREEVAQRVDHKLAKNYRTLILISHPSKLMLRIIFNRLKGKATAGRGAGWIQSWLEHSATDLRLQNHL